MYRVLCLFVFFAIFSVAYEEAVFAKSQKPFKKWNSKELVDHKLTGYIWSTKEKKFITRKSLISRLAIHDYILLGETHDNSDHHRLQAWVIRQVMTFDRRPSVVMEMINLDQTSALKAFYDDIKGKKQKKPVTNLGPALDWSKSGWPSWDMYKPIASAAFAYGLKITPGRPEKIKTQDIRKNGYKSIEAGTLKRLTLDTKLGTAYLNSLKSELNASHCNMMPFAALDAMSNVQRYVDAVMADQLLSSSAKGAFLIAGSGHIRSDRAVPYYIKKRAKEATSVSLSIVEVIKDKVDADSYVPKDPSFKPAVDYIWFTPRNNREDPCIAFKKHMQSKKKL